MVAAAATAIDRTVQWTRRGLPTGQAPSFVRRHPEIRNQGARRSRATRGHSPELSVRATQRRSCVLSGGIVVPGPASDRGGLSLAVRPWYPPQFPMPGSPAGVTPINQCHSGHCPSPQLTVLSMNPKHYYHTPIKPISTRVSCPVCHQAVYSRAGIHPQCAVIQYDPPKLRSKKPAAEGLVETAIEVTDQPVPEVVVELPIVERTPAAKSGIVPASAGNRRGGRQRSGTDKRTGVGLIR